jgi:branched-chain amino acid transport system ATP-binding protein
MTAPVLEIDGIHTYYGSSYILQGLSLRIAAGEIVGVLGRNGVGKSTLMRSIIGFTPPTQGHIRFCGEDIARLPPEHIVRLGIALVPQGRRVFRSLSVGETLSIAARPGRMTVPRWSNARVYDAFPRLRERRDQRAGMLSGGEQQMLAMGRALMARPKMICMDEPSMGLSPLLVQTVFDTIQEIRKQGVTVFVVEQNAFMALNIADRGYVLQQGRIVLADAAKNLLENDLVRSAYLGG